MMGHGIGYAVKHMRDGGLASRAGWNGKGMWIGLHQPDPHTDLMDLPYVYMKTVTGEKVPWLCSQTDLLASDWCILDMYGALIAGA